MIIDKGRLYALRMDVITYGFMQKRMQALAAAQQRVTAMYGIQPRGGGTNRDRISAVVARVEDLKAALGVRLIEIEVERKFIECALDALDARHRIVLYLRYIEGKSWQQVEDLLHYDERHIMRLHKEGLETLRRAK